MNFNKITRFVNRSALKIQKNSPKILFYAGIIGGVATTVMASRATLSASVVVQTHKDSRSSIETQRSLGVVNDEQHAQEVVECYTNTAMTLTKLYAPTILVGVASIAALTKSHQQLTSRNAALTAAYTGLFKTFEAYRERVRGQLGDEQDQRFLHGTVTEEVEVMDAKGNVKVKEITSPDPNSSAALSYYYDCNTSSWCKDPGYNQTTLDNQQTWANIKLKKNGHLFLNEVYDMLHIPHTKDGNILGWVYEDLGDNDMYVDFGHHQDGEFVAGFKRDVMLNFNIHGPILDLI